MRPVTKQYLVMDSTAHNVIISQPPKMLPTCTKMPQRRAFISMQIFICEVLKDVFIIPTVAKSATLATGMYSNTWLP